MNNSYIALTLLALAALVQGRPPNACTVLPPGDVRGALGAGWTQTPAEMAAHTADLESCSYTKGVGNMVAFSIWRAPGGDAKVAVAKRQKNVSVKHAVTALPDLCEGGFTYVLSKTNTTLIAAQGKWEVQLQVLVENKPDTAVEVKLATGVCRLMK